MRPNPARLLLLVALAAALLTPRRAHAEWPHDFRAPVLLAPGVSGNQTVDAAVADGTGGAYVFFEDERAGNKDVYAQHLRGNGTLDPAWPTTGLAICTAVGDQSSIRAISDSTGGLWVTWLDARTALPINYFTRVLNTGAIAPGFAANGIQLGSVGAIGYHPAVIALGPARSLIAAWEFDFSAPDHDIGGAEYSVAGVQNWARVLIGSATNETAPAIYREPGTLDLAFDYGTINIGLARFSLTSGLQIGSLTLASSTADASIPPRIASDGNGGADVVWADKTAGQWAPAVCRYFGGQPSPAFGVVAPTSAFPITFGDMVYTGNYQTWFTWGFSSGSNQTFIQPITRFAVGSPVLTGNTGDASHPLMLAGDGLGGVVSAMGDLGLADEIVTATRRTASFATPALWSAGGSEGVQAMLLVRQVLPGAMCSDGDEGALVFGYDLSFIPSAARGIRLDKWGAFEGAAHILAVKDVPNDQGGQVRVSWKASYLDREENAFVNDYRLWRQVPVSAAQALLKHGAPAYSADATAPPVLGTLRVDQTTASTFAWELVNTQIAAAFANYSLTVTTVADSGAGGPANTVYMVEAHSGSMNVGWSSPADSGRSVDNLPPATPAPFTQAAIVGGTSTQLAWGGNAEPDLANYELYRGASAAFTPALANLIAKPTDTSFLDPAVGQFYKLAAVDSHGNRSGFALASPAGTLAVPGDATPRALALALSSANPSAVGATLRYALPAAADIRLALFDLNGRIVRELFAGRREPGAYTSIWDGRDANGALAPNGMYFATLLAGGRRIVERIVLSH